MISQRKSLFFFVLRMVFHIFAKDKLHSAICEQVLIALVCIIFAKR